MIYYIPEHFTSDDCFEPYSLPIKNNNKIRLTTNTYPSKQTMTKIYKE